MHVNHGLVSTFLTGGGNLFKVPIFQRHYEWDNRRCQKLIEDLRICGTQQNNAKNHYIGSITTIPSAETAPFAVNICNIIDGQQRLTTLSLLGAVILALSSAKNLDQDIFKDIGRDQLINDFVYNQHAPNNRFKLRHLEPDRASYEDIVRYSINRLGAKINIKNDSAITKNYNFMYESLQNIGTEGIKCIIRGMYMVSIVSVILDNNDDAPEIFENMNAAGQRLEYIELLKNFSLMGLPHETQNDFYTNHWLPFENSFRVLGINPVGLRTSVNAFLRVNLSCPSSGHLALMAA